MKKKKIVIIKMNLEIKTNAYTEKEAIIEAENIELPNGYVEDSYKLVKVINEDE